MKTWNSSKFLLILLIFLVWFLSSEYLNAHKPKMCPRRQNVLIPAICIQLCWVFFFIQIYLPQVTWTKTWKSRRTWTFLDFDITTEVNLFVYKLSEKRNKFSFFAVRMPYLSSNILSAIFYGSKFSEILRIASCTVILTDVVPKACQLCARIRKQGGNKAGILRQTKKTLQR